MNGDTRIKVADNRISDAKKEIDSIDVNINASKETIKNIESIEETFESLNKNMAKCINLLNKSMKGKEVNKILSRADESRHVNIKKSLGSLESYKRNEEKKLKEYYDTREELFKREKEEIREKENQEE